MATRRTRKKKEAAQEPAAFVVGEEPAAPEDERPPLGEDTVSGLLAFSDHIEQRVPSGLLWPLAKHHPSMQQYLSDLESADAAVNSTAIRHAMTNDKMNELRAFLASDGYAMSYLICGHRDIVPEVHMAMCYASTGQAQKLAWLVTQSGFDGYIIDQYREEFARREIDPKSTDGIFKLDYALRWQNHRYPRGWYKSSAISHGGAVTLATNNPNQAILLVCAKEDKAFQLVTQVGKTVTSGIYRDLFPYRVPDSSRDVSGSSGIILNGRTVSARERTVQGASYITREISGHYSVIFTDDIVIRDVRGGIIGGGPGGPAIRWLHGMRGMRIMSMPWMRVHLGTINDVYEDDHAWLTYSKRRARVFTIVAPAETYPDGKFPDSVYVRGTPTAPTFFNEEKIIEALNEQVADESEADGVEAFRSDFWLAPTPNKTHIFDAATVNDVDRVWLGPFKHPKAELRNTKIDYATHFLVAKIARNADGSPLDKGGNIVDVTIPEWRAAANKPSFDVFEDMDRVLTLDPTWRDGGRRWGLSATAIDSDLVKYLLEARAGDGGMGQWIAALAQMAKLYRPRVIGIDRHAFADSIVQNAFDTDPRLRRLKGFVTGVDHSDASEEARIRAGVAGPLNSYRLLLPAQSDDPRGDFGASLVRKEMLRFRAGSEIVFPVLDSIAMADSVMVKVPSREQRERAAMRNKMAAERYRKSVNDVLGVPSAA